MATAWRQHNCPIQAASDAGRDASARRHFGRLWPSSRSAAISNSPPHVLGSMSHLASYLGEPDEAIVLARQVVGGGDGGAGFFPAVACVGVVCVVDDVHVLSAVTQRNHPKQCESRIQRQAADGRWTFRRKGDERRRRLPAPPAFCPRTTSWIQSAPSPDTCVSAARSGPSSAKNVARVSLNGHTSDWAWNTWLFGCLNAGPLGWGAG